MPGLQAEDKMFTIVIDAGHGGKDPGARGTTINEKVINLSVALKLGNLISEKHRDVKVIYTRKTDRFITLNERANIANRNKADLFVSIHTNAIAKGRSVSGTETFTLGLARSDENLEVAMRENAAILLEENYLEKYEGFDPNSTESYIIFEFMQNKHMEQSISLASEIQKAFKAAKRPDRGVKQGGLLVLRKTSMPSVLVELGFITNAAEERFLKSADGQNKLAKAIYDAFVVYKHAYDKNLSATQPKKPAAQKETPPKAKAETTTSTPPPTTASPATTASPKEETLYKIQILASRTKLPANSKQFKGYKNVSFYEENGYYKYTYGESADWATIRSTYQKVRKDFKDSFIVTFKNGKRTK
ncbi:MAG: N-acetylmuramoyl-L-alanine amidase [Tannerellaceae bacterium]|jgi:N-acetylmuramoyl-L-alanine amidase|nr:N-acetylmuramoyl-L-alanine amidase [Tannerellaceae bacterium]